MENQNPSTPSPVDKIAAALAKAQAEFVQPEKNKTVDVKNSAGVFLYSFDYADYNAIVEAVRGPLSKNGIAFTHLLEQNGTKLELVTMLIHTSGQVLECVWPIPNTSDPKAIGGAMTYGKRYCLSAITGCVADDDLDAEPENVSKFNDRKPEPPKTTNPIKIGAKPGAPADPNAAVSKAADEGKKWASFWVGVKEYGWTPEEVHAKAYEDHKVATLTQLTPDQLGALRQFIKANPKVQA